MITILNNMPTFFSQTDNEELQENAGNHNTYLSLIVNNRMEMCAKLAIKGSIITTESSMKMRDPDGDEFEMPLPNSVKEVIFTYACNIAKPVYLIDDETFAARVKAICEVPKQNKTFTQSVPNNQLKFPVQYSSGFDTDDVEEFLITFLGGKKKNTLDNVLNSFKYFLNYSPESCIKAAKTKGFRIFTNSDEQEFIEEVLSILDPYEFDNLEELKNKYHNYLDLDKTVSPVYPPHINYNNWNAYY